VNFPRTRSLVAFLALTCLFLSACRNSQTEKSRINAAAVHQATREFAEAARKSAPNGTVIRIKHRTSQDSPDRVEVTVFSEDSASARKTLTAQILLSLGAVAQRYGLQTAGRHDLADSSAISYRSGLRTTHAIEIRFVRQAETAQKEKLGAGAPQLAIILDDFGSDRAAAEAVFAMPYPLTISILPNHEHSREIAEKALQRGYQVMLHLPMQSVANEAPEKEELRPGMTAAEVRTMLDEMVESIPNVVGANNHQGSQATCDPALMRELMPALHQKNLFYIDSRTTAATVAFDEARREGVATAYRNVPFLDDVQDTTAIRKQLAIALRDAKEKKSAIAIGHPHAATLEALREFLPTVRASGVRLVFASDVVR